MNYGLGPGSGRPGTDPARSPLIRLGGLLELGLERLKPCSDSLMRPADERAVAALQHADGCAPHLGQLKGRHASGEGVRGECGAQVVEACRYLDAGGLDG